MAYPLKRPLLAVDTNIPLAVAESKDFAFDCLQILKDRLNPARIIVPPTAFQELVFGAEYGETESERELSERALRLLRSNQLEVVTSIPMGTAIVDLVAERFHAKEVLPSEEHNDALILAEASLLGCAILLTSDADLRGIDFQRASFELNAFDLSLPVIATPREIIAKFG